jgi:hypothetical protein
VDSVITYGQFWLLYLVSALVAYWCWGKLLFWVKTPGVGYYLFSLIGAVLIFTPVPIEQGSMYWAPGFLVVAFTFLISGPESINYCIPWFAAALAIGAVVLGVGLLVSLIRMKDVSDDSEAGV